MRCERFSRRGAVEREAGDRDLEHLLACRRCRRRDGGYARAAARLRSLPTAAGPRGPWRARVLVGIAATSSVGRVALSAGWRWAAAAYAVAVIAIAATSVSAYAQELRMRESADATMRAVARDLDRTIAGVEATEAEDDLRFQIVHVAWAQLRAVGPGARKADIELVRARERAMDRLCARLAESRGAI